MMSSSGLPVPGMAASCCTSSGSFSCGRYPHGTWHSASTSTNRSSAPACASAASSGRTSGPASFSSQAAKEALADGLERVGDAQRVLAGDLIVRVQAEPDIFCPELPRFRQQGHDRRGHLPVLGRQRPLLAVARAGVRQDLAHDPARDAAHVAVRVHEQLVEEHERLALVGPLSYRCCIPPAAADTCGCAGDFFSPLACSSSCSSVWSVESVCMRRMEPSSVRSRRARSACGASMSEGSFVSCGRSSSSSSRGLTPRLRSRFSKSVSLW